MTIHPSARELYTILAALRLYQDVMIQGVNPDRQGIIDIASNSATVQELLDYEIDDLCERLNTERP